MRDNSISVLRLSKQSKTYTFLNPEKIYWIFSKVNIQFWSMNIIRNIFIPGLNIGWRIRTFDWLCVRIIRDATSLPASHFFTTKHFKCQQSIYDEFTKSSWYRRWLFSLKCEISSKSILTIFTKVIYDKDMY